MMYKFGQIYWPDFAIIIVLAQGTACRVLMRRVGDRKKLAGILDACQILPIEARRIVEGSGNVTDSDDSRSGFPRFGPWRFP